MDWPSIAGLLAERSDKPLVLLDRAGRIRLLSGAMEQALGWRRYEVEGQAWAEAFAPPELADTNRGWLAQALRGALARYECEVVSRSGQRLLLLLDLALVGRGRKQGLLVTVQEMSTVRERGNLANRDVDYRVVATATEFGSLEEICCVGHAADLHLATTTGPCFTVLHGRDAPCPDCPILRQTPNEAWPRTAVRRRGDREGSFEILTAEPASKTSVRMSVRMIADSSLVAIHDARIAALAEKAHLTERERDILNYLLLGRTLDDIASMLDLSRRTVKFHQGNILQKLGADSRTDLIRLIGF